MLDQILEEMQRLFNVQNSLDLTKQREDELLMKIEEVVESSQSYDIDVFSTSFPPTSSQLDLASDVISYSSDDGPSERVT